MSVFVSAVYDIYGDGPATPSGSRQQDLLARLRTLAEHLVGVELLVFCHPDALAAVGGALAGLPQASAAPLRLEGTAVSQALQGASELPPQRSASKDTKAYMLLMCNKTELVRAARELRPAAAVFAWVDAGITKILEPDAAPAILARVAQRVRGAAPDRIWIPGCWPAAPGVWPKPAGTPPQVFTECVLWRFCGGFAVLPAGLVAPFADAVLEGCRAIAAGTGCAVWEVNVWASVEHRLPIAWYLGSHDATIFDIPDAL